MPRLIEALPRYRKHWGSVQAIVALGGETSISARTRPWPAGAYTTGLSANGSPTVANRSSPPTTG